MLVNNFCKVLKFEESPLHYLWFLQIIWHTKKSDGFGLHISRNMAAIYSVSTIKSLGKETSNRMMFKTIKLNANIFWTLATLQHCFCFVIWTLIGNIAWISVQQNVYKETTLHYIFLGFYFLIKILSTIKILWRYHYMKFDKLPELSFIFKLFSFKYVYMHIWHIGFIL